MFGSQFYQPGFPASYPQAYPQPVDPYRARLDAMQRYEIVKVNGENGATAFAMPPNSSVLMLDENEPIVWLAQTDGAGYKTVKPYKIEPFTKEVQPDARSLEERIKKLEDIINAKSDT